MKNYLKKEKGSRAATHEKQAVSPKIKHTMERDHRIFDMEVKAAKRFKFYLYAFLVTQILVGLFRLSITESPFVIIPLLSFYALAGINFALNIVHERQKIGIPLSFISVSGIFFLLGLEIYRYFLVLIKAIPGFIE